MPSSPPASPSLVTTPAAPASHAARTPRPEDWIADPRRAFDDWMAQQGFRASSILVYRAQWHHFLDWLAARNRTLLGAEPALIDEFAATIDVKRQQRARYLRIMERVFDDMTGHSQAQGNPARAVTRSLDAPWTDTVSNAPTGFLDVAERGRLWQELGRTHAADGQALPWRDLRDRAMAAMLLGAGLKLNELESMQLAQLRLGMVDLGMASRHAAANDQSQDWAPDRETDQRGGVIWIARLHSGASTRAAPSGSGADDAADDTESSPAVDPATPFGADTSPDLEGHRAVPFPLHAAAILIRWLRARSDNEVAGELAFPAGRSGLKMHKATALRAIDVLVESSGLRDSHHGRISPQTLRNAYAAALFTAGADDALVAERLGMIKILSARRLRAAWDLARAEPGTGPSNDAALHARASRRRDGKRDSA